MATLAAITRHATANQGGLIKFYLALVADVTTIPAATDSVVSTDLTMSGIFYEFEFTENTAKVTEPMIGGDGDSNSFKPTIELNIGKNRSAIDNVINNAVGGRFIIIVKDANDQMKIYGDLERPMRMIGADGDTGADAEDKNTYKLMFEGNSNHPAYTYTGAVVTA